MPIKELKITLVVAPTAGGREHAVAFVVPADGQAGLTLTAAQKTKLGDRLDICASLVDENETPL